MRELLQRLFQHVKQFIVNQLVGINEFELRPIDIGLEERSNNNPTIFSPFPVVPRNFSLLNDSENSNDSEENNSQPAGMSIK